jgi:hypothetical protein
MAEEVSERRSGGSEGKGGGETVKVDHLINFCPRCVYRLNRSVINNLGNGGDWECFNCECYVEAYVLDESSFKIEE